MCNQSIRGFKLYNFEDKKTYYTTLNQYFNWDLTHSQKKKKRMKIKRFNNVIKAGF